MRRIALAALALALAGQGSLSAKPGDPPESCQGVVAQRGMCLLIAPGEGPVTYSVSGTAYGATEARIQIRLEDALTGKALVECSADRTGSPVVDVTCQRSATVEDPPLVSRCVAEGAIAGRFFCDAI
ncbi:MAG TPA: hypothetical protein VM841_09380 [Actinomycetota bacterium]|nr:hypothetical protein [Actinomycetota bacterium]